MSWEASYSAAYVVLTTRFDGRHGYNEHKQTISAILDASGARAEIARLNAEISDLKAKLMTEQMF